MERKNNKALLVEDTGIVIKTTTRNLTKGGWDVDLAKTSEEAIDKINNSDDEYALLILDENLEDESLGSEIIKDPELDKSKLCDTLIICNSAQSENRRLQADACNEEGLSYYNSPSTSDDKPMTLKKGDDKLQRLFSPEIQGEMAYNEFYKSIQTGDKNQSIVKQ